MVAVGSQLGGTVSLASNAVTFTPTPGYIGAASFTYQITDGTHASVPATVELTVLPPPTTAQLFAYTDTPANLSDPDTNSVNLGVKFNSSQSGLVTGLKYYKGIGDTGTHVGSLWTSDGTLLASATFTNESASGWQYVTFAESGRDHGRHDLCGELQQQWPLCLDWKLFHDDIHEWHFEHARARGQRLHVWGGQPVPYQRVDCELLGGCPVGSAGGRRAHNIQLSR